MIRLLLLVFIFGFYNFCFAQICTTDENVPDYLSSFPQQNINGLGGYTIRVAAHLMQDDYGNQGISLSQMYTALQIVENDLRPHNICISLVRYFWHWDSQLSLPHGGGIGLLTTASSTDAIDIYFLPPTNTFIGGTTTGVPSYKVVISGTNQAAYGGQLVCLTHALSHEIGHCLGLYHTYHGSPQCITSASCPELVNGNCSSSCTSGGCGDYVVDTPADPCMSQSQVDATTCAFPFTLLDENGQTYNPDTRNIMSYSHPDCQQYFSSGQGDRMRTFLSSTLFTSRLVPHDVYIQNLNPYNLNYITQGSITAGYNVTTTPNGYVEIINTSRVMFQAIDYIDLKSGFSSVPTGVPATGEGFFKAEINPNICGSSQGVNSARLAQITNDLPTPSAWLYTEWTFEGNISTLAATLGDTILNGQSYTIIKREIVDIPGVFSNPFFSGYAFSYLRFDSAANKVFAFENSQDRLMYDYSLNIGDTFPTTTVHGFILTSIDSIPIINGFRKRFIFEDTTGKQIVWVKGLGNISNPFNNTTFSNFDAYLVCYHEHGALIYEDQTPFAVQCSNYTNIENVRNDFDFQIFPNPTQNDLFYQSNYSNIDCIELTDITGMQIYVSEKPKETGTIELQLLPSGIYFLKFTVNNGNIIVKKVIKY